MILPHISHLSPMINFSIANITPQHKKKLDKFCQAFLTPEFDRFIKTKSLHPLFYKELERFFCFKKMRTIKAIL